MLTVKQIPHGTEYVLQEFVSESKEVSWQVA